MELLAPAGDMAKLETALLYGADAVYLAGKEFGLRTASDNFTHDQMLRAIRYAHERGVRVYVTLNTMPRNDEIDRLPDYLRFLGQSGADGVLVTDIGVMALVKHYAPTLALHISTQANTLNYAAANAYYQLGARRIVLARELSFAEIAQIRQRVPDDLELEMFVHGAMCISYSGRCLLSNYLAGRDSNRGNCAHTCRWGYTLKEANRPDETFDVLEEKGTTYILNSKDLCLIRRIKELYALGVNSLKIEGRVKSEFYVATITGAYRAAMDAYEKDPEHYELDPEIFAEVNKVSHRRYFEGFADGVPDDGQSYADSSYLRSYDIVATVTGYDSARGLLLCRQKNKLAVGDIVEIMAPRERCRTLTVSAMYDAGFQEIALTNRPASLFSFPCDRGYPAGTILRRRSK